MSEALEEFKDEEGADEVVAENVVVDLLTGAELRWSEKEEIVQRMIRVLAEEYRFPLEQMGRDVAISVEVDGKRRRKSAELVVYLDSDSQELDDIERGRPFTRS